MKRVTLLSSRRQPSLCIFCASRRSHQRHFHAQLRDLQQGGQSRQEQLRIDSSTTDSAWASQGWGGQKPSGSAEGQSVPHIPNLEVDGSTTLSAEEQRIRQKLKEAEDERRTKIRDSSQMNRNVSQRGSGSPSSYSMRKAPLQDVDQTSASRMPSDRTTRGPWTISRRAVPPSQAQQPRLEPEQKGDSPKDGSSQPAFRLRMHDPFRATSRSDTDSPMNTQWGQLKRRNGPSQQMQDMPPPTISKLPYQSQTHSQYNGYTQESQIRMVKARDGQFVGFDKANIRCHQCGQLGHIKSQCPSLSQKPLIRRIQPSARSHAQDVEALPSQHVSAQNKLEGAKGRADEPITMWDPATTRQGRRDEVQQRQPPNAMDEDAPQETSKASRVSSRFDDATPSSLDEPSSKRRESDKRKTRNIQYAREAALLREDAQERAERRRQKDLRKAQRASATPQAKQVSIPEFISIGHLATLLSVRATQFERSLKRLGFTEVNHDYILNAEDASLIAQEYDFEPVIERAEPDEDLRAAPEPEDKSSLPERPPVVTIMGHVDHGKTTILDYMRSSSIAASEHGGITQHIGAFSVPMASGRTITFLDTPGHAAFLTMRQRGANVTDIVVLVVAADDSVMPQTIESIRCAKTAGVPMIVAINKMDKEDAAPERVKQDLARHGVEVEDFGGDTQVVPVSGKTGLGMNDLEEAIATLSEILDQRADPTGVVEGWILEASTKKSGRVATILIRRGTLKVGDIIVAGTTWARVRTMRNEFGELVTFVTPGMPVEVDGWRDQPSAGEEVLQAPDEQRATAAADYRITLAERVKAAKDIEAINEARRLEAERRAAEEAAAQEAENGQEDVGQARPSAIKETNQKGPQEVFFIVKGDVSGSVEAVLNQVSGIGNADIRPVVLRSAVGPISQGDVDHAAVAKGTIIAFNTSTEPGVRGQAERAGVGLIEQSIIYRLVEDVTALLESKLPPEIITKVTGEAEVAQPFSINLEKRKFVRIAGSKIKNGTINLKGKAKVLRGGEVIYTGTISSLKNKKQEVREMKKGSECGIAFEGWEGFEIGDQIQCFAETERRRTL